MFFHLNNDKIFLVLSIFCKDMYYEKKFIYLQNIFFYKIDR